MKKQIITTLLVLSSLSFKAVAAESKPLPPIAAPRELVEAGSEFMEGTVTRLSADDVAQFLPWAQNAQKVLSKALVDIESMPVDQQVRHLNGVMQSVVRRSGDKTYQMFMRFALNRGMLLTQELLKEADIRDAGTLENALDLQVKTIKLALQAYESDLSYQQRVEKGEATTSLNYANFGLSFAKAMFKGIDSVFDASAQYRLLYKTLEIVNWDLSRDASANNYADTIIDIYNSLSVMNEQPANDDRSNVIDIRRLNLLKEVISGSETISFSADFSATNSPDIQREVRKGEVVTIGNRNYTILGSDSNGKYAVESTDGYKTISSGISRDSITVTFSRYRNFSSGERVVIGNRYYTLSTISNKGLFTVMSTDGYKTLTPGVNFSSLAKTSGCLSGSFSNICVNTTVIIGTRKYTIAGILPNGEAAVKSTDGYNTLASGVKPESMVVVNN